MQVGPTGCGKTEIARRLAKLCKAPFVKVEATKFTEVRLLYCVTATAAGAGALPFHAVVVAAAAIMIVQALQNVCSWSFTLVAV